MCKGTLNSSLCFPLFVPLCLASAFAGCLLEGNSRGKSSLSLFKVFTWSFWKIQYSQGIDLELSLGNIDPKDQYGCSGSFLMSSDLKGLVKSWKVKGNKKDLLLVMFRPGPRRLESLTWKDGAILTGKEKKKKKKQYFHTVLIPSSLLLRRTLLSGNGRPRNETGKWVLKAKIITWHDFKSFSPHELHQSDHTVSSLFNILSESRKNKRDDPRLVNTRISKMQKVNSVN